jgi:hypothetical protein
MTLTKIYIIGIIFINFICVGYSQQVSDREQEKLSNEVSGVTRYTCDLGPKDSIMPDDPILSLNWNQINGFTYNHQGSKTLNISYNFDPKRFTIYDYDANHRVIVEDMFIGDTSHLYRGKRHFYNQEGKLAYIKYKWKVDGITQYSYQIIHYENGFMVKDCQLGNDSTVIECEEVTEVIEDGKKTITRWRDGKPRFIETEDAKNGLLYSTIHYKSDGSLRDSETHTCNEKGQVIKTVMGSGLFGSITYWYYTYEYNPDGTLSKTIRFDEDKMTETENLSYDEHKNIIIEAKTNINQNFTSVQKYTYTYDPYGNWIVKLCSIQTPWNSFLPIKIEYRKLTYFE